MRNVSLMLSLVAVLAVAVAAPVVQAGRNRRNQPAPPPPPPALTADEADAIVHMREEEKLARDVYLTLAGMYDLPVFAHIAASEQQHLNAVAGLIATYGLDDPVTDDRIGEFSSAAFADLYIVLVEAGSVSLADALSVGALIEEMDIVDLQEALALTDKADIQMVFENLMRGSRNHLRAFAALLAALGESYEAQYLTQAEFDAIADSPKESGGRRGRGGR